MKNLKLKSKLKKSAIFLAACYSLFFATNVLAAEIFFETNNSKIKLNEQFNVSLFIDTNNKSINAIEGKIIFPQDILEVKNINDGNSIINFWIEKPTSTSVGQINFSGIVPGGYNNSRGLILSVTFLAKKEGSGTIKLSSERALLNDGEGTETSITISNLQFIISKQFPTPITIPQIDKDLPEDFIPKIEADPEIFEGKWFLVFYTQDKGSGIDHYEVQEGNKPFVIAESPYLLKNQLLNEKITVKAVDKAGNERIVNLLPKKWLMLFYLLIIVIITAIIYSTWKQREKRKLKKATLL